MGKAVLTAFLLALPKRCIKISNRITPTLPSPLRGGGLGWGAKGTGGEVP